MATKKKAAKKKTVTKKAKRLPSPRIEIVHSKKIGSKKTELFARVIAKNGLQTFRTSETYKGMTGVKKAIATLQSPLPVVVLPKSKK